MLKQELLNGDIVITRDGCMGVIIKTGEDDGYILYNDSMGYDELDFYSDDLLYENQEEADVMEVYRNNYGPLGFNEVEDEQCFYWTRDKSFVRPLFGDAKNRAERLEREMEESRIQWEQEREERERQRKELGYIDIITQCFYENRTWTQVRRDAIPYFIQGILSEDFYKGAKPVDLKMVKIPKAPHLVLVYDQNQENRYIEDVINGKDKEMEEFWESQGMKRPIRITCKIDELNFELHTRCFVCRIDEEGVLQSIEDGDESYFIDYLSE